VVPNSMTSFPRVASLSRGFDGQLIRRTIAGTTSSHVLPPSARLCPGCPHDCPDSARSPGTAQRFDRVGFLATYLPLSRLSFLKWKKTSKSREWPSSWCSTTAREES
jgi:hypothetical protein